MKSYTDIFQSRKLAEILPLESADMHYKVNRHNNESKIFMIPYSELGYYKDDDYQYCVCAWSLAALLEQLPCEVCDDDGNSNYLKMDKEGDLYQLMYGDTDPDPYGNIKDIETDRYGHFVDACVDMIIRLNELNLL